MDIWDHLLIATMMAAHDSYIDNEKKAKIIAERVKIEEQFYQKYMGFFIDAAFALNDVFCKVSDKANPNYRSADFANGCIMMPLYVFSKVQKASGNSFSQEQTFFINEWFSNVSVNISKDAFMASLRNDNGIRKKMKALVEITDDYVGDVTPDPCTSLRVRKIMIN